MLLSKASDSRNYKPMGTSTSPESCSIISDVTKPTDRKHRVKKKAKDKHMHDHTAEPEAPTQQKPPFTLDTVNVLAHVL